MTYMETVEPGVVGSSTTTVTKRGGKIRSAGRESVAREARLPGPAVNALGPAPKLWGTMLSDAVVICRHGQPNQQRLVIVVLIDAHRILRQAIRVSCQVIEDW